MYKKCIEIYYAGNFIGRTIFLTSENYRMTNNRPQTKIFTGEKIISVFPPFNAHFHQEKQNVMALSLGTSRLADIV